ncbi:MAG: PHP-associated domain-containing protein, partial [Anaerolineaceae bacterium]|nr:PHP-associated domain-containing protein [Anaerolineaceae bacterium]
TAEGHLLALFIHTQIPAGRPLVETVLRVAEQGGLCVAAHPTARGVHSLSFESVRRALQVPEVRSVLVGAEALNSGLVDRHSNHNAQALAEEFDLAATGSTDSHVIWTIGHAATEFPGRTSQDLRTALVERTTWPVFQTDWHSLPYYLSFISRRLLRQLGWVTWTPEPNSPFVLQRLARVQA